MKIIKRAIAAWVSAVVTATALTVLRGGAGSLLTPDFASGASILLYAGLFMAAFLFLTALQSIIDSHFEKVLGLSGTSAVSRSGDVHYLRGFSIDNAALLLSVNILALISLRYSTDITLLLGLLVPVVITDVYVALDSTNRFSLPQQRRLFFILAIVFGAAQAMFIALYTCARYNNYASPNYDFGIFCNMFSSMVRDFTQTVSCERDAIIQHFAVHFSPIYYLMLPFYFVFRSPLTLQILQAVIVGSGVIPLYLITRRRKLSPALGAALCFAYALYPALIGGCSYDMHENCFLAPLLLWLFYCAECDGTKRRILTALFAVLTLAVKEDAAVYVAFFGIYKLISDGRDEPENPVSAQSGSDEARKKLPAGKRISAALDSFVTAGRCCGLALLPLITRLPHRLLLLCPLLLIGLMSDYQYQHSIYFQYVFGWCAFLFYAAVLNLSDLGRRARRALCAVMLSASVLFSAAYAAPLGSSIFPSKTQREKCAAISEAIADIPGDASVTSDTFILPHLADREIIYELDSKATSADTDYVVFDLRYADAAAADERETAFTADGYETVCRTDGVIMIMKR